MLALFSRFRSTHLKLWKELTVATTSYLIMFQQLLKKSPVNPSGPGALSDGNLLSYYLANKRSLHVRSQGLEIPTLTGEK